MKPPADEDRNSLRRFKEFRRNVTIVGQEVKAELLQIFNKRNNLLLCLLMVVVLSETTCTPLILQNYTPAKPELRFTLGEGHK